MVSSSSAAFIGGALSFKGDKKKNKKKATKKNKVKHDVSSGSTGVNSSKSSVVPLHSAGIPKHDNNNNNNNNNTDDEYDEMTQAERAAYKKKQERELKELEMIAKQSHRERVEAYNEKLSQLTEHNDIPRVSAAGNG